MTPEPESVQKTAHNGTWIIVAAVGLLGVCLLIASASADAPYYGPSLGYYDTGITIYSDTETTTGLTAAEVTDICEYQMATPVTAPTWAWRGFDGVSGHPSTYWLANSFVHGETYPINGTHIIATQTNTTTLGRLRALCYNVSYGTFESQYYYLYVANLSYTTPAHAPIVDFTATNTTGNVTFLTHLTGTTDQPVQSYNWTVSGPGTASIATPSASSTDVTITTPGSYTVNFSATNTTVGTGYMLKSNYLVVNNANASTVRTYFQNVDGNHARIYDSDISIFDHEANLWQNSTTDQDGTAYIDSQSDHTLSGYGHKTGYIDGSKLNVLAWSEGLYEIKMEYLPDLPTPADGDVVLIVYVNDATTKLGISLASVKGVEPSGTTNYATTQYGKAIFQVPNQSLIVLTASKTGYSSASASTTTTAFGPDTVTIELSPATPVPTGTVPTPTPTGSWTVTPTPTTTATIPPECVEDPNSDACHTAYSDDVWSLLYEAGPAIMSLAICAILLGLLKMIMKF